MRRRKKSCYKSTAVSNQMPEVLYGRADGSRHARNGEGVDQMVTKIPRRRNQRRGAVAKVRHKRHHPSYHPHYPTSLLLPLPRTIPSVILSPNSSSSSSRNGRILPDVSLQIHRFSNVISIRASPFCIKQLFILRMRGG